jgi:signal transduction histidine kinase
MSAAHLEPGPDHIHSTSPPAAPPDGVALSPALRAILLDPALWHDSLDTYARATHLAVALTDVHGDLLGKCLNPQPTWQLLQARAAAVFRSAYGEVKCPFSLVSHQPCSCIADALAKCQAVMVRDRTRLVHFAVPLILGGERLGVVLAGQVFDQYPEQMVLEQVATQLGLSPVMVWQRARLAYPIKRDTLRVYADLLMSLSQTFLQTRYDALQQAESLAKMTRLRDETEQARAEALRAEKALRQAYDGLEQRVQERTIALTVANNALHREIEVRQRLEVEHRHLEDQARRAEHFALLGRLAAGVSHEIRNPLGVVFLQVDILTEDLQQLPLVHQADMASTLAEIKTHLARLDDIVQDYLSLVRVHSIQRQPAEVGAVVEAFAQEISAMLTARDITLQQQGLTQLGTVDLHQNTFRRALLNLVHNAMDAMPQGGTLSLCGRRHAAQVQLEIRDTGPGIPAEHLSHIFEPLFTTKPGGTGLGLYIVHEIITAHDGTVVVKSTPGHGTIFTLTLPLV